MYSDLCFINTGKIFADKKFEVSKVEIQHIHRSLRVDFSPIINREEGA